MKISAELTSLVLLTPALARVLPSHDGNSDIKGRDAPEASERYEHFKYPEALAAHKSEEIDERELPWQGLGERAVDVEELLQKRNPPAPPPKLTPVQAKKLVTHHLIEKYPRHAEKLKANFKAFEAAFANKAAGPKKGAAPAAPPAPHRHRRDAPVQDAETHVDPKNTFDGGVKTDYPSPEILSSPDEFEKNQATDIEQRDVDDDRHLIEMLRQNGLHAPADIRQRAPESPTPPGDAEPTLQFHDLKRGRNSSDGHMDHPIYGDVHRPAAQDDAHFARRLAEWEEYLMNSTIAHLEGKPGNLPPPPHKYVKLNERDLDLIERQAPPAGQAGAGAQPPPGAKPDGSLPPPPPDMGAGPDHSQGSAGATGPGASKTMPSGTPDAMSNPFALDMPANPALPKDTPPKQGEFPAQLPGSLGAGGLPDPALDAQNGTKSFAEAGLPPIGQGKLDGPPVNMGHDLGPMTMDSQGVNMPKLNAFNSTGSLGSDTPLKDDKPPRGGIVVKASAHTVQSLDGGKKEKIRLDITVPDKVGDKTVEPSLMGSEAQISLGAPVSMGQMGGRIGIGNLPKKGDLMGSGHDMLGGMPPMGAAGTLPKGAPPLQGTGGPTAEANMGGMPPGLGTMFDGQGGMPPDAAGKPGAPPQGANPNDAANLGGSPPPPPGANPNDMANPGGLPPPQPAGADLMGPPPPGAGNILPPLADNNAGAPPSGAPPSGALPSGGSPPPPPDNKPAVPKSATGPPPGSTGP